MSFDIDVGIKQMANAMEQTVGSEGKQIAGFAVNVMSQQKESLEELAQARLDGDLDEQEFEEELQREMLIVQTEMLSAQVLAKATIQKAINAAINTLMKSVVPI